MAFDLPMGGLLPQTIPAKEDEDDTECQKRSPWPPEHAAGDDSADPAEQHQDGTVLLCL